MKKLYKLGLGISAFFVFLVKPRLRNRSKLRSYLNWDYAHRGLHDDRSPENSLTALKKAVEAGYAIEMDVRISQDGLVIHHDEDLLRSAGKKELVEESSTQQLKKTTIFNSQETIPSLEEALGLIDARVPLLLEIKSEKDHFNNARKVQELMDDYRGAYLIESFHPLVLLWYRLNRPGVLRGQLSGDELNQGYWKDLGMRLLLFNFISRPDFIAYGKEGGFSPWFLARLGTPSFTYTVVSPEEKKDYFDAVIFEKYRP